jgi:hypothetical protein
LSSRDQIALIHHANDAPISGADLSDHVAAAERLFFVILAAVGMSCNRS